MTIQTSRTIAGVVVIAIFLALFWYMKRDTSYLNITSFEECVQAGYQVTQATPQQCSTPDGRVFISTVTTATSTATTTNTTTAIITTSTTTGISSFPSDNSDRIRITGLTANQKIVSPLTVKGQARGGWYFEASFPVQLMDGNGKPITQVPATAIGEWMTNNFVPFSVTLTFAKPATATGTLILRNDNPSGLPENERWISIPVRF